MAGISLYARFGVAALEDTVVALRAGEAGKLARLEGLEALVGRPADAEALEQQARTLETVLLRKHEILEFFSSGASGSETGFAAPLEALGRSAIDGVWLTAVRIEAGTGRLGLEGVALGPELLPRYLERLAAEAALAGSRFSGLEIEREEAAGDGRVAFRIRGGGRSLPEGEPYAEAGQ
jgi:hypothetical protein